MQLTKHMTPSRILFAMLRVSDLKKSIAFYTDLLGMHEIERETFEDAKFTAVYMGYGDKHTDTVLELTYNWNNEGYEHGTAFGNISLAVEDVYGLEQFLKEKNVTILRPAGELSITPAETGKVYTLAHIQDPDGYRIELIQSQ